jgi:putative transposase
VITGLKAGVNESVGWNCVSRGRKSFHLVNASSLHPSMYVASKLSFSLTPAFKPVTASERWTLAVLTAYDQIGMSMHSYSRCWIHLIWGTLDREKLLDKPAAARVSLFLADYAEKEGIYMKVNFVNADHVHTLIDLPTALSVEKVMQLLKGASSHWINSNDVVTGKFAWSRGYGAFSVSESNVSRVARYIADQEEHHRVRTFAAELREFIDRHGLRWKDEESR